MSYFLEDVTRDLAAALKAQKKVQVIYGDEGFTRDVESGPHVQVLEDVGDDFVMAPTTQNGAQPSRFRKNVGILIKIKGASPKSGAKLADHRGVVDALADLIVIALQEIAHNHKQKGPTSFSGTTIRDQADEAGTDTSFSSYELHCKWERGVNKAKSFEALQATFDNGVIAHRMVLPMTEGAAISAKSGDTVTVSALAGIDESFVGKTLTLAGGANEGNNGDFPIVTVLDDSSVQITNANASIETGLSWSVSDDELAQES